MLSGGIDNQHRAAMGKLKNYLSRTKFSQQKKNQERIALNKTTSVFYQANKVFLYKLSWSI